MDQAYESDYLRHEDTNWWCRSRREIILDLVRRFPRSSRVLDIGCSSGSFLFLLRSEGFHHVYGVDSSAGAVSACFARGVGTVSVMNGGCLGFPDCAFDVVVASDVLEHCIDERGALLEWRRVLKPGGTLIVFVPAFPFLWGPHDERSHHHRRYTARSLCLALRECRLTIGRVSYWNFSLFIPALLGIPLRRLSGWSPQDRGFRIPPWLNAFLYRFLAAENAFVRRSNLAVGVSLLAEASKSD